MGDAAGLWSLHLSTAVAWGSDGSHLEDRGVDAAGNSVPAPLHEHAVTMNVLRTVLDLERRLAPDLALRLRLPFEARDRRAAVRPLAPATEEERANMQRGLDLHHPDETLTGLRDAELLAAVSWSDALRPSDLFEAAYGLSLPSGATEPNPYRTDGAGNVIPHEHVQFGSGSFDPLLRLTWTTPLAPAWSHTLHAAARWPLYENRHDFRAPREISLYADAARELEHGWRLRAIALAQWSGKAEWNGSKDPNTGWLAAYAGVGAERRGAEWSLAAQLLLPLAQDVLGDGGETFDLGPVVTLTLLLPL